MKRDRLIAILLAVAIVAVNGAAYASISTPSLRPSPASQTISSLAVPSDLHVADDGEVDVFVAVMPLGMTDDGLHIDLVIVVEPETHTREWYIVQSPLGLAKLGKVTVKAMRYIQVGKEEKKRKILVSHGFNKGLKKDVNVGFGYGTIFVLDASVEKESGETGNYKLVAWFGKLDPGDKRTQRGDQRQGLHFEGKMKKAMGRRARLYVGAGNVSEKTEKDPYVPHVEVGLEDPGRAVTFTPGFPPPGGNTYTVRRECRTGTLESQPVSDGANLMYSLVHHRWIWGVVGVQKQAKPELGTMDKFQHPAGKSQPPYIRQQLLKLTGIHSFSLRVTVALVDETGNVAAAKSANVVFAVDLTDQSNSGPAHDLSMGGGFRRYVLEKSKIELK